MNKAEIKERDQQYIEGTYARYDLCIESGKGAICKGYDGREYIDFTSGIGVNCMGFCDAGWVAAVTKQLGRIQHTSNLFYTEPCGELAELLVKGTGMKKVFFSNSGAEANEAAIKTARKYSNEKYGNERNEIITLINSFHGRTMATITATGQAKYHAHFNPFMQGFSYAVANDIQDLNSKLTEKTCAIMLEIVQGEGGVLPLDEQYIKAVEKICKVKDILLIVDEIQTGIGRTGKLFAYEHFDISPDLVSFAKGIGGGLPIGGILIGDKCVGVLKAGNHGTTYGGNPVVCAGGVYIMQQMTPDFLAEVAKKGTYIKRKIEEMPNVLSVKGLGMMLGIEIEGQEAQAAVALALEKGLLLLTAKEKIRLLPPLTIVYDEIDAGLTILEDVLTGEIA